MKKTRNIKTDYQRIGSYKGVSIYARTFWGNVDFALFNIENIDESVYRLNLIKNSFNIQDILKDIDKRLDIFYNTKKYKNQPTWHTWWNEDLDYWIKYLENID